MFTLHIDLGQVIISFLIGSVGWFVKRTIDRLEKRLDHHDEIILDTVAKLNQVLGQLAKS